MNSKQKCDNCSGSGLVKCIPIKCNKCVSGCYTCNSGYIQFFYKECIKCFSNGIIN